MLLVVGIFVLVMPVLLVGCGETGSETLPFVPENDYSWLYIFGALIIVTIIVLALWIYLRNRKKKEENK